MVKIDTKASIKGLLVDIDKNGDLTIANKESSEVVNIIKLLNMFKNNNIVLAISKSEDGDLNEEEQ